MAGQYYIETYGCQMNVADSQLVAGLLNDAGHTRTGDMSAAQIVLLNTCAIREKAEETVHNRLDALAWLKRKDPSVLIVAANSISATIWTTCCPRKICRLSRSVTGLTISTAP